MKLFNKFITTIRLVVKSVPFFKTVQCPLLAANNGGSDILCQLSI